MIITVIFTLLSAWYDNGKRFVDHTPRFIFRVIVVGLISYFSVGNFLINFAQNTVIFYLLFDYSLNLFEGRKWNYVGTTSKIDQLKREIFGQYIDILDPLHKIIILIITACLQIL